MSRCSRLAAAACLLATLIAGSAAAQLPIQRPTRLPAFGRSIVSTEDTTALVLNPANIAFLPAAELRWSSIYLDNTLRVPWEGHAFAFGIPIPLIPLGTAIRFDAVSPPDAAERVPGQVDRLGNYQWLTWGLALRPSERAALGFTLQRAFSEESRLVHALGSWSFGLTTRPFNALGLAVVFQDVNGPRNEANGHLERSYDFGLAFRPLGSRVVELGLEGKLVDAEPDSYWIPRATLGIDIPWVGRLRGEFSMSHPEDERERAFVAAASLAMITNNPGGSGELAFGSVFGNGLGPEARYKAYNNVTTEVAFRGWREPTGPEAPRYAVRVRIEDTPSARAHVAMLRTLWSIAEEEPSIDAVVFELRTAPADSLARAQELRDAIGYLRRSGKRVLCHLEDADGTSLYLCSAADRILINPAGGLRFAGLRTRHLYFKGLLDKLGIHAEFVRIGEHKSAPEGFVREGSTDVSRADQIDLLQQHERQFVEGIAAGRQLPTTTLRERFARGPFIASEARQAGLVDGYAYDDQLEDEVSKLVGYDVLLLDDERAPRAPRAFGTGRGIAIVYVDGDMVDGRSQTIPFLGMKLAGSYTIAEALKQARQDASIGAIVLRVETGGGSAMAAEVIWREVAITARVKPVVVSMGTYAASGGYYVAASGTRIFANPLTLTGSIGIFYGKADVAELLRKIGVGVEVFKTAPRADGESIFRPFTDDERKELQKKVGQFYDVFLSRVSIGRKLSKAQVHEVGQGRVWTGEQAFQRKLVDELGGLRQAMEYARRLAGLPSYAPVTELPPPDTTLLGRILGIEGIHDQERAVVPAQLHELLRALGPFLVHPADKPLARMELVPVGP
jgi:protease-4